MKSLLNKYFFGAFSEKAPRFSTSKPYELTTNTALQETLKFQTSTIKPIKPLSNLATNTIEPETNIKKVSNKYISCVKRKTKTK